MTQARTHGFSLVDVVVGIALMLILFLALFGVLRASLMLSALTKAKTTGVELANSHMEYLRGLSYDALGTVGGIPAGLVPQTSTTTVDGVSYVLRTLVVYHDDPADGLGASDVGGVVTDYKKARVSVTYALSGLQKSVVLISNFVPPSLESSTGGGTISIRVVDATSANVSGASVRIVNASITPAVDFTISTNDVGLAVIAGAATSSEYQIFVSRSGYSSAQTYARTAQNVNPTPGYLTVSKDQVTNSTFFIDRLSTLTLASYSPHVTASFADDFVDNSKLALMSSTTISNEALALTSQSFTGSARSITIPPTLLTGWGLLSATLVTPSETTALVRIVDGTGVNLPDSVLPGNSSGFSSFPISITTVPITSYPTLAISAELSRNSTSTTPAVLEWSLSHTSGPFPLPNLAFTITGEKTIGTGATGLPIFKTVVNDTTGASAEKSMTLEWDTYSLTTASTPLIESCSTSPYALLPASTTPVALLAGTLTTHNLPIIVLDSASSSIPSARVVLTNSVYAATISTSACGLAFFNDLTSGTYSATVNANGHTTTIFPNISVSGNTATSTLVLP